MKVNTLVTYIALLSLSEASFASKCSIALEANNRSANTKSVRIHLHWGGDNYIYRLDDPINGYIDRGYVATMAVEPHSTAANEIFYFCGYDDDPTEFWLNYRVHGKSRFASVPIESRATVVRIEVR